MYIISIAAINNIAGPSINALISTSISCNGLSNGTASISASGTGSLSYLWSYLSQTTNSVNNLPVGIYTVTVNDPYTCSSTATFNISQPPAITLTAIANNTVVCLGNSSTLTANVIGGGVPPYTYTWSSGGNASIKIVTPITASTYTINIKDANNCLKTNTVSVATNSLPIITTSASGSLTCSNSAVNIYATTGAGLLYSWNGSGIVSGANSATAVVNAPGIYSVNVTSSINGCSVIKTVTVSLNNAIPLIFIFSSPSLICSGQTATLMASGANTYAWSSGGTSATEIVSPTTNTIYTVNGTDVNGCSKIAISNITVNPLPTLNTTSSNSLICTGQNATLTATGATTYIWSSGGNSITEVVSPTVNTTYTVNGTDGNGCSNSSSITQSVSLCTGLAIQNGVEAQSISIFPNPTNGILNVASTSSATELQILNVLGQVVQTTNIINQTTQLNISDLKNGLYFVKVLEGNKVIATQKIIKE